MPPPWEQAEAVLKASEGTAPHAYIVLSLPLGARTEELRPLTWPHDLDGAPPSIMVWRSFRAVLKKAGLNEKKWTPREMRHSSVSLLSDPGIPLENISRPVGHRNTSVTETVYRKQLRPALLEGAEAVDQSFPD
ncbi:tyrosine-type recombinase/integrase [Planobispora longispora]|uniref:Tyr recombinase domain-containing protein n=1 Tax=Planobispora longispora TaxID=28887 RepID=A0A8J3RIQ8_9ACTN|nr:tyrosine-type recombinase/integrase [Planobispora longispora]GIH77171.1 hypothetical protein Plo01_36000 [Planobispora longispora]